MSQQPQNDSPGDSPGGQNATPPHEHLESYGGGHIKARHGRVNGSPQIVCRN